MGSLTANTKLSCQSKDEKTLSSQKLTEELPEGDLEKQKKGKVIKFGWIEGVYVSICHLFFWMFSSLVFIIHNVFRWDASWTFGALCFSFASPGSWVSVALVSKATSHYGVFLHITGWVLVLGSSSYWLLWASPLAPGWVANRQVVLSQEGEGAIWSQLASSLTWWKLCPVKVLPSGLGWHALSSKPWPRKVVRSRV